MTAAMRAVGNGEVLAARFGVVHGNASPMPLGSHVDERPLRADSDPTYTNGEGPRVQRGPSQY